jgi:hypothetical protein
MSYIYFFLKSVGSVTFWFLIYTNVRFRDSAVGIATAYRMDDGGVGVRVQVWSRNFSSPRRPDRLWGSPSFLTNGYRGLFPQE